MCRPAPCGIISRATALRDVAPVGAGQWLPNKYVRINSGNVPVSATPAQIPGNGLSIEESFQRIGDSDTRIMLKKIELHPEYRDLLHACIGELEALGLPSHAASGRAKATSSSPPRTRSRPYHMDPEINFLLQVRGGKTFHVLSGDDRSILTEEDIELFYAGKHQSLTFREEATRREVPFAMQPGDGVHIPVNHPHWVTTDNEVTISFALTLQTAETKRRGVIYAVNHQLRRRGLNPTPYGRSVVRDFIKHQGFRLWSGLRWCLPVRRSTRAIDHWHEAASFPGCLRTPCLHGGVGGRQGGTLAPGLATLLERSSRNELTQSPDWLLTWWHVYGGLQGRQLRLGLFHDAGRLVGLAPLLRRRHCYGGGLPFRRLEFLASGEPRAPRHLFQPSQHPRRVRRRGEGRRPAGTGHRRGCIWLLG